MTEALLIASGAYAGAELVAVFGELPPAFLPIGNRRLYELQADAVAGFGGRKVISLPGSYDIPRHDEQRLAELGFEIVRVADGLGLGASLSAAMETAGLSEGALHLLHGDTLFTELSLAETDVMAEGETESYQSWAEYEPAGDGTVRVVEGHPKSGIHQAGDGGARRVLAGYFSFSDAAAFAAALEETDLSFIGALNRYQRTAALTPKPEGAWLDFGHVDNYYRSRAAITTERAFNALDITRRTVRKASSDRFKLAAEASWYRALPGAVRVFAPQFLGAAPDGGSYEIEYLYLSPLSDLFVFGRLPDYVWDRIFQSCDDFLAACGDLRPAEPPAGLDSLYLPKTLERLESLARTAGVDLDQEWRYGGARLPGLRRMAEETAARIPPAASGQIQLVHGDFCFSNILFDFRANAIKVVDPRGHVDGETPTAHGDVRYDLAKLHHSAIGRYDHLIAGRYALESDGGNGLFLAFEALAPGIEEAFLSRTFAGMSHEAASSAAISVLLFLSMLPLHGDDTERQRALLANALRLFAEMEGRA